jgi:Ca2+-binding RTX toxin-like protein
VRFDRISPAPFAIDIGASESLVLNAKGGNDTFSATGNLAALISITVDGGPGDDTLLGSNGIDTLRGGENSDFVDGQQGNDIIFLGAGDDTVQWDPGDGNDIIEGETGNDRMLFNGANIGELFELTANGPRVRFTRNIANIFLDLAGIETFDLNTLGGADNFIINNLAGTGLTRLNTNLAGTIGGSTGDGQADVITFNGTAFADTFDVSVNGGVVEVTDLGVLMRITSPETLLDDLIINGLGDVDTFTVGPGVATLIDIRTINDRQ